MRILLIVAMLSASISNAGGGGGFIDFPNDPPSAGTPGCGGTIDGANNCSRPSGGYRSKNPSRCSVEVKYKVLDLKLNQYTVVSEGFCDYEDLQTEEQFDECYIKERAKIREKHQRFPKNYPGDPAGDIKSDTSAVQALNLSGLNLPGDTLHIPNFTKGAFSQGIKVVNAAISVDLSLDADNHVFMVAHNALTKRSSKSKRLSVTFHSNPDLPSSSLGLLPKPHFRPTQIGRYDLRISAIKVTCEL